MRGQGAPVHRLVQPVPGSQEAARPRHPGQSQPLRAPGGGDDQPERTSHIHNLPCGQAGTHLYIARTKRGPASRVWESPVARRSGQEGGAILLRALVLFRRRALGRSSGGRLCIASRWRSGRNEAAASHFSQYASAERRASSHVVRCPMGLRHPFGRLRPLIFQTHCSRSASGSLITVATGSSPLSPCHSALACCSQRIIP